MAESVSADPRVGTELAGYQIEALIGRGGMSVVYRAEHLRLKRKVAIKILNPELAADERFRERFLRESELAASLDHPNVIPIYDASETEGVLFIAMRHVEGTDLGKVLDRERAGDVFYFMDGLHEWDGRKRGARIGSVVGFCTFIAPTGCYSTGSVQLPAGSYIFGGWVDFTAPGPQMFAVLGGSGEYENARGTATLTGIGPVGEDGLQKNSATVIELTP